jgi:hypothetical protein
MTSFAFSGGRLLAGRKTIVLIDHFAACMDFDLLTPRVLLKFHIEALDEFALQRINRVVTHDTHYQNTSEIFREDRFTLKNEVVYEDPGSPANDATRPHWPERTSEIGLQTCEHR